MGEIKTLFRKVVQIVKGTLTKFCDNVYRGGGVMLKGRRVKPKTYDVLDVSRYIINYSNEKEYGVSNLKLQKLLYFVQAYFLILPDREAPLFDDKIEAWDFGPVVPAAYSKFKHFGASHIPSVTHYYEGEPSGWWRVEKVEYNEGCIDKRDRELINVIVDKYKDKSATYLVGLTHKQKPWMNAYIRGMNREITPEAMRSYFNG